MKTRTLFILLILFCGLGFATLKPIPQDTGIRVSTTSVQRRPIAVTAVTIDACEPNFAEKTWTDAQSVCVTIPVEWSNIVLSFYGYGDGDGDGDPCNTTFSFDVYVCDIFSGLECVSSGNSGTVGAVRLSHDPTTGSTLTDPNASYKWADDINEGTKKTTSTIAYSDYESADGLAKMKFDRHSAYGLYVRIYNMTAQSVTSITCIANGFNQ